MNFLFSGATAADKAIDDIKKLRIDILKLVRERNRLVINITQYQKDFQEMKEIYDKYKALIPEPEIPDIQEYQTINIQQPGQIIQFQQPVFPQQMVQVTPKVKNETYKINSKQSNAKSPVSPKKHETVETINENDIVSNSESQIVWTEKPGPAASNFKIDLLYNLNTKSIVTTICYSPKGDTIAFADNRSIHVIDAKTGNVIFEKEMICPNGYCDIMTRVIRYSPDGNLLAVSTSDTQAIIFSVPQRDAIGTLEGHTDSVSSIEFLNNENKIVTAGFDGNVILWDISTKKIIKKFSNGLESHKNENNKIISLAVTKDDKYFIVGYLNANITVLDSSLKSLITFKSHNEPLLSVASSPVNNIICTTSHDGTAKIWDLNDTKNPLEVLTGHEDYVICSTFSPVVNDKILITGSKDQTIKIWNTNSGELISTIESNCNSIFSVSHHPTEKVFASCTGDGIINVWSYTM